MGNFIGMTGVSKTRLLEEYAADVFLLDLRNEKDRETTHDGGNAAQRL